MKPITIQYLSTLQKTLYISLVSNNDMPSFVLYITVNQPAKACRVVPATRHAAAPVLAVATVFSGGSAAIMCLNKKDLPVPALPVNIKKQIPL